MCCSVCLAGTDPPTAADGCQRAAPSAFCPDCPDRVSQCEFAARFLLWSLVSLLSRLFLQKLVCAFVRNEALTQTQKSWYNAMTSGTVGNWLVLLDTGSNAPCACGLRILSTPGWVAISMTSRAGCAMRRLRGTLASGVCSHTSLQATCQASPLLCLSLVSSS